MKVLLSQGNKSAFTIIEVLMALGILVTTISIIVNLEFRALTRVLRDKQELERIFSLKKEAQTQYAKPPKEPKKVVTKFENPELVFTTQFTEISPKSSLAPLKDRLYLAQTTGVWKNGKDQTESSMLTIALRPKPDKEKEKK